MSKKRTSIKVDPNRPDDLPVGDTDWARLDAMTDAEAVANAASDPDAPPSSPARLAQFRRAPNVRGLRERLGMTQAAFAKAYHLPLGTVRDWEQGRRLPDAPARALLTAIERAPKAVLRALA